MDYEYIIVTGASGFIGRNFISKLKYSKKIKYIFIYRKKEPSINNVALKNYILIKLDLTKKASFNRLPKRNIKIIYHFASEPNTFVKYNSLREQFCSNTVMTLNIADYCKTRNVRFLFFASSVYVYSGTDKKIFKTDDKMYPKEILGASKLSCELILNSWSSFITTKIIILRFFTVYGQGANPNQLIPSVIKKIKISKKTITFYKNSMTRDFINISDVVDIMMQLTKKILKFKKSLTVLNIGNGKKIEVLFVIKYLIKLIKPDLKIQLIPQKNQIIGDSNHCADISDLKKIVKYRQKISIKEGLKNLI